MVSAGHKWEWAGIAVRDIEGNMVMWELSDPIGSVDMSQEMVGSLLSGTIRPGPMTVTVRLSGVAQYWDGRPRGRVIQGELAQHPPPPLQLEG